MILYYYYYYYWNNINIFSKQNIVPHFGRWSLIVVFSECYYLIYSSLFKMVTAGHQKFCVILIIVVNELMKTWFLYWGMHATSDTWNSLKLYTKILFVVCAGKKQELKIWIS